MKVRNLIEYMETLPDDMEVYLQTCEDDLCTPITFNHLSTTMGRMDERYGWQKPICVFTAFIKGQKSTVYRNKRSGFVFIDEKETELDTGQQ